MTDDLVKRAREALVGVTPGKWYVEQRYSFIIHRDTPQVMWDVPNTTARSLIADTGNAVLSGKNDAHFTAASRDLVPAMADRIEALTAERDAAMVRAEQAEAFSAMLIVAMNALLDAPKGVVPTEAAPFYDGAKGRFCATRATEGDS